MLQATKEAEFLVNKDRKKPVALNLDYFFVEADKGAATHLEHELKSRGYGSRLGNDVFLRHAEFGDQSDTIIEHIQRRMPKAGRAIFLLDQYGYSKVPIPLIRKILQTLPGGEVILTFAVDALLNYVSDKKDVTHSLLEKIGTPDALRG